MNVSDSGFEAIRINAVGTVAYGSTAATLHTINPEVSVGTIRVFDAQTVGGTTAANLRATVTGGTAIQDCFTKLYDIQLRNGLVVASEGTPIATLSVTR